jgi:hypothetical protein
MSTSTAAEVQGAAAFCWGYQPQQLLPPVNAALCILGCHTGNPWQAWQAWKHPHAPRTGHSSSSGSRTARNRRRQHLLLLCACHVSCQQFVGHHVQHSLLEHILLAVALQTLDNLQGHKMMWDKGYRVAGFLIQR